MPRGLSLNIGVTKLNTGFYRSGGALQSPQNNARAMAALAVMEGYETPCLLLNENANKTNFLRRFDSIIKSLNAGDTFLLTFSGHGGQVKDHNGDEEDCMDETWCFYDEYLVDDEIGDRWKDFKSGVQIIVVSDSCNSRTAIRVWNKDCFEGRSPGSKDKCEKEIIINNKTILSSHIHDPDIKADIIHLSACDDGQRASAGRHFSKFTGLLLKHWDYGRFTGTYQSLISKIRQECGYHQNPWIKTLGANKSSLQNKIPFKLINQ